MTSLACVIGWPIADSLSPAIHNAAFAERGLDWTYVALAVRPGAMADGMRLLDALEVAGANVTMPHKRSVLPFLARVGEEAARLDAVNTLVRTDVGWVGHNTDGEGFLRALRADAGFDPAGRSALILGAGGAARAVAVALAGAGASVRVGARRAEQAAAVAALDDALRAVPWGETAAADLIVNATPAREGLPLDRLPFGPGVVAVDLITLPPPTSFLRAARAAGTDAHDGLGMLVHQAALSFRHWTGREAPIDVMAAAARVALASGSSHAAR